MKLAAFKSKHRLNLTFVRFVNAFVEIVLKNYNVHLKKTQFSNHHKQQLETFAAYYQHPKLYFTKSSSKSASPDFDSNVCLEMAPPTNTLNNKKTESKIKYTKCLNGSFIFKYKLTLMSKKWLLTFPVLPGRYKKNRLLQQTVTAVPSSTTETQLF